MKGIKLLFTACIALLFQNTAVSFAATTASRSIPRHTTSGTSNAPTNPRERTATSSRRATTPTVTSRATSPIRERTVTNSSRGVSTRTVTPTKAVTARTTTTPTRTTRAAAATSRSAVTTRTGTTRTSATRLTNRGRSATTPTITREDILARDASKCRAVFNECMDEFCANKDAQLKRCACSTRINEFRGLQENLDLVEDKLLDFGQRLLTVSMEKEDAAALHQATEGELAFNKDDRSESKKQLDEIAKKLNTSFDDNNFDQNLNAISLSLNIDSAFDGIDSMAGASTTTKSGTALYSAALPKCREMAQEVCSPEELSIAEGAYQMLIEQDCNTVKKSFQTQSDQARAKVFENSALLDMSRLDIHQQRNSDDILTCKSKMLDMLTNSTVCGEDMVNCLDTSGQYINPTTGSAILSVNLVKLNELIKRPSSGTETWTNISSNSRYITFLNGKKKFLEPAMEQCQNISDLVWQEFLNDALAQIKLAQDAKLEQVRQSCTTLTTQCLDNALTKITEFDERALSIFGVTANKTVTAMCAEVNQACTALFRALEAENSNANNNNNNTDTETDWEEGMAEISLSKTYETLMSTCREIGRNCIIQNCSAGSDQFGLCNDTYASSNRHSILERKLCWTEVKNCIAEAGDETINKIIEKIYTSTDIKDRYKKWYGSDIEKETETKKPKVQDICSEDCQITDSENCKTCRLSEMIWGNCVTTTETTETTETTQKIAMNIKNGNQTTDLNETSLLSWLALQTNTSTEKNNCTVSHCPSNYEHTPDGCMPSDNLAGDKKACLGGDYHFKVKENHTNCCSTANTTLKYDNEYKTLESTTCCGTKDSGRVEFTEHNTADNTLNNITDFLSDLYYKNTYLTTGNQFAKPTTTYDNQLGICRQKNATASDALQPLLTIEIGGVPFLLLCIQENSEFPVTSNSPNEIPCKGKYVLSTKAGILVDPYALFTEKTTKNANVYSYFYPGIYNEGRCTYVCKLNEEQPTQSGTSDPQSDSGPIKLAGECQWLNSNEKECESPLGWSTEYTGRYL